MIGTVDAGAAAHRPPTPARSTSTGARPGWSSRSTSSEHVAVIEPRRPDLLDLGPRDHRHLRSSPSSEHRALGRLPAVRSARSTSRTRSCRSSSAASPAARCSARSRSTCPSARCAPRPCGGPCPTTCSPRRGLATARPARRRARRRALLDRPAPAVRDLRPLGHRRRLDRPARRHRPLTVFVYDGHPGGAGFAERGFHAAARVADRDPRGDRRAASARAAAPRASSPPSAATRTTRSTRPAPSACSTCCWPERLAPEEGLGLSPPRLGRTAAARQAAGRIRAARPQFVGPRVGPAPGLTYGVRQGSRSRRRTTPAVPAPRLSHRHRGATVEA